MPSTATTADEPTRPTAEHVWLHYGDDLRRFVRRRIADPHRADDVVGEILLRVHMNLHTVTDERRLAGWLYQVARNAIVDDYRRVGRQPVPLDRHLELATGPVDHWIDDRAQLEADMATCMRPLLDCLPATYRRALELTDLGGATQIDAARIEGVSVSGMKSRVQRGRHRMRELLHWCCELTLDAGGRPTDCRPRPHSDGTS